jgi:alpha/beta hydrolase fold
MTTKLSSITRRSFCRGLAAMAVLPLAARCGAVAQTDPQRKIQTSILEVPGARLYYETHGTGPVMVMVPGATGTADSFRRVTEHLVAQYTVAIYDRRGFSRSQLNGPQDYDHRLESDADDVRRFDRALERRARDRLRQQLRRSCCLESPHSLSFRDSHARPT